MNQALRRMGHEVDEIWQPELGRRIKHGNLHYLLELPQAYRRAMSRRLANRSYDVVELNQPHAYLAARDFRRGGHHGVFVNRSHGHEVRSEEILGPWRDQFAVKRNRGIRGLISRGLRPWLDRHWVQVARFSDGFHVSCSEDAEFLRERYQVPVDQIGVVTQGIPDNFVETPRQPMTDVRRRKLLYVGQLAFFKAPMILAQAVTAILESRPELSMTWVCGLSHHVEVRSLFSSAVLPRVSLVDWRPQVELLKTYDEHGIFLFPSFFEGFGKAPLEAMARGLCVVASNTGGMRDFIRDGVTGRLVPVGQPELFSEAVIDLLNRPSACDWMSREASKSACQHTWDRCARDVTDFYLRLLTMRQKSN
ncbi:MAG: glycosyltransferase family 4 protein [Planctomycetes bacterium]|nr:glycosyltransferase family 4 protein [Planctomycetota bacterium]